MAEDRETALPFDVLIYEDCPPDTMYIIDPAAIGTLARFPVSDIMLALERKTILCGTEEQAERIRETAQRVGRIDLDSSHNNDHNSRDAHA